MELLLPSVAGVPSESTLLAAAMAEVLRLSTPAGAGGAAGIPTDEEELCRLATAKGLRATFDRRDNCGYINGNEKPIRRLVEAGEIRGLTGGWTVVVLPSYRGL